MTLNLLLADDHQIVRQGLRAILEAVPDFRLVGEAADGPETVRLVERLQPDVLVLDLMLPGLNGLEVARHVARRHPRTRVVILSMHNNEAYVVEALRAGAIGYVLKESGAEELVQAIRKAAAGTRYLSRSISEIALGTYVQMTEGAPLDPYQTLTLREREVLQLTVEGLSAAEIARRLHISRRTVETHRANLMGKLGVHNQRELTRDAVQRGILLDSEVRGPSDPRLSRHD
jgi:DNA-binding NarL/FixJ family response regulator